MSSLEGFRNQQPRESEESTPPIVIDTKSTLDVLQSRLASLEGISGSPDESHSEVPTLNEEQENGLKETIEKFRGKG